LWSPSNSTRCLSPPYCPRVGGRAALRAAHRLWVLRATHRLWVLGAARRGRRCPARGPGGVCTCLLPDAVRVGAADEQVAARVREERGRLAARGRRRNVHGVDVERRLGENLRTKPRPAPRRLTLWPRSAPPGAGAGGAGRHVHRRAEELHCRRGADRRDQRDLRYETCPISTEGWTRRVHFVREGGGGGGGRVRGVCASARAGGGSQGARSARGGF